MADQGGNEGYFTYGMPPSQMMDFSRQTGPNNYSGQDVKPMLFPQYEGHANGTQNTAMMAHSGYQQNAQSQREMMQHMLTSHQVHQQAQLTAIEPHRPSSSSAGAEGGAGMAATGGTDDSSENGAYTPKSHHIGGSQPFPLTTSMSSLSITPGSAAAPIVAVSPSSSASTSTSASSGLSTRSTPSPTEGSQRKCKSFPKKERSSDYHEKRLKNNESAKKSREKKRLRYLETEREIVALETLKNEYLIAISSCDEQHKLLDEIDQSGGELRISDLLQPPFNQRLNDFAREQITIQMYRYGPYAPASLLLPQSQRQQMSGQMSGRHCKQS